jgi:hypothetical protein
MNKMPQGDPYIESILARVPADVARTLTPVQWDGFREALEQSTKSARHMVDFRCVLPLYFVRFYFIWIFGRDRRERVEHVLVERRRRMGKVMGALVMSLAMVAFLIVAFVFLYIMKSAAGIDLIPGFHLSDWIPGLGR